MIAAEVYREIHIRDPLDNGNEGWFWDMVQEKPERPASAQTPHVPQVTAPPSDAQQSQNGNNIPSTQV